MAIKRISVIGGDLRQEELARLFLQAGYDVITYGLRKECGLKAAQDPVGALDADVIVLPVPICNGNKINAPFYDGEIKAEEILDNISWKSIVLGGKFPDFMSERLKCRNVLFQDYLEREELAIKNAELTAEGALEIAISKTDISICGSKCLVTGWGRIAKFMAGILKALGADVTIFARKLSARAEAEALGFSAVSVLELENVIDSFDIVFNTVPAMLFDKDILAKMEKNTLIIDLASKPGGVDFNEAENLGLRVIHALGLPGKVAYKTAGKIIYDTIQNILLELEV